MPSTNELKEWNVTAETRGKAPGYPLIVSCNTDLQWQRTERWTGTGDVDKIVCDRGETDQKLID